MGSWRRSTTWPLPCATPGRARPRANGPYLDFFLQRYADAYRIELSHFIDSVTRDVAPSPSILDGRAALILADAATLSATTGERVTVAAGRECVTDIVR